MHLCQSITLISPAGVKKFIAAFGNDLEHAIKPLSEQELTLLKPQINQIEALLREDRKKFKV